MFNPTSRSAKLPYCIRASWPTGVGSNHPSVKRLLSKNPDAGPIELGDRFETIEQRDEFLKLLKGWERNSDANIELYEDYDSPPVEIVNW